jgi:hypothetical protein
MGWKYQQQNKAYGDHPTILIVTSSLIFEICSQGREEIRFSEIVIATILNNVS